MSKLFGKLFNLIGAIIRFLFGTFWRSISNNQTKFSFEQYKNGSIISNEWVDNQKHNHINKILGFIVLALIILSLKSNY